MGKKKLIKGIAVGAVIGGLITITADKETRQYVQGKLKDGCSLTAFYAKNPAYAVNRLNEGYQKRSKQVSQGITSALELLNELEDMTSKLEQQTKDE
ncbi:gas vesicle protein [Gracilibacillus halotolerans]|uniref:Gas vesicle protein n=1 Tax=Gracilibacillus halotolerans TaxID=74386 RepID=A0A841RNT2_9BACI|nr:hypothetical protein [Gracilibacillus halotolerans]MBB6513537.1 gas vesicle protein [Gracilibacillus halotolerans]